MDSKKVFKQALLTSDAIHNMADYETVQALATRFTKFIDTIIAEEHVKGANGVVALLLSTASLLVSSSSAHKVDPVTAEIFNAAYQLLFGRYLASMQDGLAEINSTEFNEAAALAEVEKILGIIRE